MLDQRLTIDDAIAADGCAGIDDRAVHDDRARADRCVLRDICERRHDDRQLAACVCCRRSKSLMRGSGVSICPIAMKARAIRAQHVRQRRIGAQHRIAQHSASRPHAVIRPGRLPKSDPLARSRRCRRLHDRRRRSTGSVPGQRLSSMARWALLGRLISRAPGIRPPAAPCSDTLGTAADGASASKPAGS